MVASEVNQQSGLASPIFTHESGALREMAIRWGSPQECLHAAFLMVLTGSQIGFPQSKYLKIAKWKLLLPEPLKAPNGTAATFYWLQVSQKDNPGFRGEKMNFSFFTGQ